MPALTVLQLDTQFPRVPGDVACPDTYREEIEIIIVPQAMVGRVVTNQPEQIDIRPFEQALSVAKGDMIVTSCGFLAPWQNHLAAQTERPLICSALNGLGRVAEQYSPEEVMILTYEASSLTKAHFEPRPEYLRSCVGLTEKMHLKQVIRDDLAAIDQDLVLSELCRLAQMHQSQDHKVLVLECTNLPPYKQNLRDQTGLSIEDILFQIEEVIPNTVAKEFL